MGVNGSMKIMDRGTPARLDCSRRSGIVIDTSHLIHQLVKSQNTTEQITDSNLSNRVTCFKMLRFILSWLQKYVIQAEFDRECVFPIFVFDGKSPKIKQPTINKRASKQKIYLQKLKDLDSEALSESLIKKIDVANHSASCIRHNRDRSIAKINRNLLDVNLVNLVNLYTRCLKNSYHMSEEIYDVKRMLKWMGIKTEDAQSEGDSLCAAIDSSLDIHGTITADIDILLLGGKKIYKINTYTLDLEEYSIDVILSKIKQRLKKMGFDADFDLDHFDLNDLRSVCCLMGTDYCPGLKIGKSVVDLDAALAVYILNDKSIPNVLENVRDHREEVILKLNELGVMEMVDESVLVKCPRINDSYIQKMLKSLEQYTIDKVIKPSTTCVGFDNLKLENIAQFVGFCSSFLSTESVECAFKTVVAAHKAFNRFENKADCPVLDRIVADYMAFKKTQDVDLEKYTPVDMHSVIQPRYVNIDKIRCVCD